MKKILLIEDNDDIRNNTVEILELSNYKVIEAANGKIGLEKALEHKADLIICDIMMPILDGYGVLHAVQKNDSIKNTPFIFLTAKADRGDFRHGMELGADDYITKPFTATELLSAVDSRLKKMDSLKEELSPGTEAWQRIKQAPSGKIKMSSITEGRDTNKYKKKQVIYSSGNHPTRLYYVKKGKVKAYKTNEQGKELVTDIYSTGDFFGYVALLEAEAYKDTTEALEETELAIISKEDFEELINTNSELSKQFIKLLAKNISTMEDHLLGLAYNSLRKKVAVALISLQKKYGQDKQENVLIDINRHSLAAIAGTATESLIRTLTDFRNEKLIDIKDGIITIINPTKLAHLFN